MTNHESLREARPPRPWKIHTRARGHASVRVISYSTREARDASVTWYEHLGYVVTTSGPKEPTRG